MLLGGILDADSRNGRLEARLLRSVVVRLVGLEVVFDVCLRYDCEKRIRNSWQKGREEVKVEH